MLLCPRQEKSEAKDKTWQDKSSTGHDKFLYIKSCEPWPGHERSPRTQTKLRIWSIIKLSSLSLSEVVWKRLWDILSERFRDAAASFFVSLAEVRLKDSSNCTFLCPEPQTFCRSENSVEGRKEGNIGLNALSSISSFQHTSQKRKRWHSDVGKKNSDSTNRWRNGGITCTQVL